MCAQAIGRPRCNATAQEGQSGGTHIRIGLARCRTMSASGMPLQGRSPPPKSVGAGDSRIGFGGRRGELFAGQCLTELLVTSSMQLPMGRLLGHDVALAGRAWKLAQETAIVGMAVEAARFPMLIAGAGCLDARRVCVCVCV